MLAKWREKVGENIWVKDSFGDKFTKKDKPCIIIFSHQPSLNLKFPRKA